MASTVEAAAVVVVALLPGAVYTWTFERGVGRWGVGFSDRLLRFFGISAAFHALVAPATYALWRDYLREDAQPGVNHLPWWLWLVALAYVGIPAGLGYFVAHSYKTARSWAKALVGQGAPPTAWDALFSARPAGWVLMKLKSGDWIGGEYAEGSYAGGYPEPADLFLSRECAVNPDDEDFVLGPDDQPISNGYGVLVRWEEVEYLEVTPTG